MASERGLTKVWESFVLDVEDKMVAWTSRSTWGRYPQRFSWRYEHPQGGRFTYEAMIGEAGINLDSCFQRIMKKKPLQLEKRVFRCSNTQASTFGVMSSGGCLLGGNLAGTFGQKHFWFVVPV